MVSEQKFIEIKVGSYYSKIPFEPAFFGVARKILDSYLNSETKAVQ